MRRILRSDKLAFLSFVVALGLGSCRSGTDGLDAMNLEQEARTFMAEYANELRTHNRPALGARYDVRGVHMVFSGQHSFMPQDSIAAMYQTNWTGPEFFEWRDLTYDVASLNSVLVMGQFQWKSRSSEDTLSFAYTALLVHREDRLGIRLENEYVMP